MRTPAVLLVLLLLSPSVHAQQQSPCGGGFRGGGGAPPPGGFNRTRGGNRPEGFGNFSRLDTIAIAFDPAGPLTVAPGDAGDVKVTLTSNATSDLALELQTNGGGFRRNQTATPPVSATLDETNLTVPAGGSASATMRVVIAGDAPVGCQMALMLIARDPATNQSAFGRIDVQVVPGDATPAAASPAAAETAKKSPMPALAPLAGLALAALARRRS